MGCGAWGELGDLRGLCPARRGPRRARAAVAYMVAALTLLYSRVSGFVVPSPSAACLRGGGVDGTGFGRVEGGGGQGSDVPAYARAPPADGVLYDELEVHWGASPREIRKSYYRLAVSNHPDKKPGDVQAEERFKRLSEAYQILQDGGTRERYHRYGMRALEEGGYGWEAGDGGVTTGWGGGVAGDNGGAGWGTWREPIDALEVFRMFLGGGMFEHLIGPLSGRMVPVEDPDHQHQNARVLAEVLEKRLEVYVRGDTHGFDEGAWKEALQLRDQSMGSQVLRTVGYVYKNFAQRTLGKLASGVLEPHAIRGKMKYATDRVHRMNNFLAAVSSTTKLYVHLQTRKPNSKGKTAANGVDAGEDETVVRVMETLWRVHRVDVEHRIQMACRMVLRDPKVPPSVLRRRAEALMRLGRIFTAVAKGTNPPSLGVFHSYNDSYSDPLAGTPAAAAAAAAAAATAAFAESDNVDSPYWGVGDENRESPDSSAEKEGIGNLCFSSELLPGLGGVGASSTEDGARLHAGDSPYRQGMEEGWANRDAVPDGAKQRDVGFEGDPAGSEGHGTADFGGVRGKDAHESSATGWINQAARGTTPEGG